MKYQRNSVVESAPMKDETILYHPGFVRFCTLNGTATYVWERLDAPRTIGDLVDDLETAYAVGDRRSAARELRDILTELAALSFVDASGDDADELAHRDQPAGARADGSTISAYVTPHVRVMNEAEVLAEFQVTSAGTTWWAT